MTLNSLVSPALYQPGFSQNLPVILLYNQKALFREMLEHNLVLLEILKNNTEHLSTIGKESHGCPCPQLRLPRSSVSFYL